MSNVVAMTREFQRKSARYRKISADEMLRAKEIDAAQAALLAVEDYEAAIVRARQAVEFLRLQQPQADTVAWRTLRSLEARTASI